jgi:hypothetical protein
MVMITVRVVMMIVAMLMIVGVVMGRRRADSARLGGCAGCRRPC